MLTKKILAVCLACLLSFQVFAGVRYNPLPFYFKGYERGNLLDDKILLTGSNYRYNTPFSEETNEITFSLDILKEYQLKAEIILDLRIEFQPSEMEFMAYPSIKDKNGEVVEYKDCLAKIKIENKKKVNRVYFKTCKLDSLLLPGEVLYITIYTEEFYEDQIILHHSSKYPSKITLNVKK